MLTLERLKEVLTYDPDKGILRWRKTRGGAHAGKIAGEVVVSENSRTKYLRIGIDGERYFAHNLIWFWETGELVVNKIDHADRNGLNNRFQNLREATGSENKFNAPIYVNNTSGQRGVYVQAGKWRAEIRQDGKKHSLGMFDRFEDAVTARRNAEVRLYGEFA